MQKLPIGMSEFPELRKKNCVYVDKTRYVYSLINDNSRTFLSRPRRFGKSLLVSTLTAALQGKKELFDGLWIASSNHDWSPYGVIRMDFSALDSKTPDALEKSLINSLVNIAQDYQLTIKKDFIGMKDALDSVATALHAKFGKVALLIDEYDYPILHALHSLELAVAIRTVIKDFSTGVKAGQAKIGFVFVTGVSAFSKSGLSSGLNNLDNLTMNKDFFDICGYTDEEVDLHFKEHIKNWSELRNIPYEEIRSHLKTWYNGYCFKENTPTVYSPFSLTCSLHIQELHNFWFESATPQVLLNELSKEKRQNEYQLFNLDQLEGTVDLLQTFEIENLLLPALLFQMGYLTIESYDLLSRNYRLKYPNLEVKASFQRHLVALITHKSTTHINPLIGKLYTFFAQENLENVVLVLTNIISGIPYPLHINDEKFYHSLLQTIFSAAGIDVQSERLTSIGRMDLILELPNILYIVELKLHKLPEKGLDQIETQKYYEPFLHKNKKIIALGLSFLRKKTNKKKQENSDFTISYTSKVICVASPETTE